MTHHIGYPTLEHLVLHLDPNEPVFLMLITEPGQTGQHSYRSDKMVILIQQPQDNLVLYCRIPVGQLNYINGDQPFDMDPEQRRNRAIHAYSIVETWLRGQGLLTMEATIATPLDHRCLDGQANFLKYDAESGFGLSELETQP